MPRHEAGCAFSDYYGGMVISGGYDDVDSVEFTQDGVTFSSLPAAMPVGKNEHCMVDLGGGDLFVAGGATRAPPNKTFIYKGGVCIWVLHRIGISSLGKSLFKPRIFLLVNRIEFNRV